MLRTFERLRETIAEHYKNLNNVRPADAYYGRDDTFWEKANIKADIAPMPLRYSIGLDE